MKNILITGGAGYIGSVVLEKLINENRYNIIVVDDLRDGNIEAIPEDIKFIKADYGNQDLLNDIFSKYEISTVIHLAASANVPDSVINPENYYYNNTVGTLNLLSSMKKFKVSNIIFSSTAAVYGDCGSNLISEDFSTNPVNPYGYSKLACEQIIKDFSAAYNINYIIFRYFCAAGATLKNGESRLYESHLIPVILDVLLNRRNSFNIFGDNFSTNDGTGVRDYIHVQDIANAHLCALSAESVSWNSIYNLGSGKGFSVLEICDLVETIFKVKLNKVIVPRRPGDPACLITSINKAITNLNWRPSYSIERIIESSYLWRSNPLY